MRRALSFLPLLLLLALGSPGSALADGCPLPCSGPSASPEGTKLLYVQRTGEGGSLEAWDTRTGVLRFALPRGRASADGKWFFSAISYRDQTLIERHTVATGRLAYAWTASGAWALAAVSPTGHWLALARFGRPTQTSIALVDASRRRITKTITLPGDFEVETISRDGRRMFLIEHLRSGTYRVRLYDLARSNLVADPLKGKGEPAVMAGLAWNGVASPDGRWLLTLYLNTSRDVAFVHALDLVRGRPRCIFLPSGDGSLDSLKRYALKLSPDGRRLFAANPALGIVAQIDLASGRVVERASFRRASAGGVRGAGATISRDGRTLFFTSGRDLWAYRTAFGRVDGPFRTGGRVVGLGYGAGDVRVHVLRADGRLLAFAAANGDRLSA